MRLVISILACLISWNAYAEIYKWMDEKGIVNYSDTPHPGATVVELPAIQTFPTQSPSATTNQTPASTTATANQPAATENQAEPFKNYKSVTITQPENNGTIRDNSGMVTISVALDPDLQSGHAIRAILDGTPVGKAVQGTSLNITGVERGTHKLQVEVIGNEGNTLKGSPSITFYMHQTSVFTPH